MELHADGERWVTSRRCWMGWGGRVGGVRRRGGRIGGFWGRDREGG